jgi:AraC family transcriptional regulator
MGDIADTLSTSANSSWAGFLIERMNQSNVELPSFWTPSDVVILLHTGWADVRYREGATSHHYSQGPGDILISPRNYEFKSGIFEGDANRIAIELGGPVLNRLLDGAPPRSDLRLVNRDGIQDPIIASFAKIMQAEIEAGCPSGSAFGESASVALLAYLRARYSVSKPDQPDYKRRLSQKDLQQIAESIRLRLDSDISLASLANLVEQSPYQFCRLFKNAAGVSPHQFIMRERVGEAKRLLRETRRSIVEISLMVGFSSQSHFTNIFRRIVGVTPGQYRFCRRDS